SATLASLGPASRAAAADVVAQLLAIAAPMLDTPADHLAVRDGRIVVDGDADRSLSVADATGQIAPRTLLGSGAREPNPEGKAVRTFGAQCVEVEVDVETGDVAVLRIVTSHDCGRIVNPTLVDSQVVGGVTQGVGFALLEERVVDDRIGHVLNPNLETYHVPTVADVPSIEHARVGVPDVEANPTGAKGVGEPPLIPTAPAIANAVYDAIGVRLRDGPLTRRRVLEALAAHDAASNEGGRP
ncbi:MAG TPA: molybdopterin cofactor-binding domain-containing protein, partial [Thermomicrobiales bacterium]|nr:molybdopterin cofactor-binding domain-containing protein [Thermomicrobiales bacterium]